MGGGGLVYIEGEGGLCERVHRCLLGEAYVYERGRDKDINPVIKRYREGERETHTERERERVIYIMP